jgi:serine/threonine protein kinase
MSTLLSQGGFGCVYLPGINCNGTVQEDKKYVTKFQINNFNAQNEKNIGSILKKTKNFEMYFLPVIKSCPINLALLDSDVLNQCEIITKKNPINDYVLMSIPYIKSKSFFYFIKNLNVSKKNIFLELIDTYLYLLNSIAKLLEKDIVHFDLKTDNILYNSYTYNPVIIDFGISIPINEVSNHNIRNYFYVYAPEYFIWPLEVHVICYLLHRSPFPLTDTSIKEIVDAFILNNKPLSIFSDDFKTKFHETCTDYLSQYIDEQPMNVINKLKNFYTTWDNYALSILYLFVFSLLFENKFIENSLMIYLSKLLIKNIHPNPQKRYSIEKTIEILRDFIFVDKSKNYNALIENINFDIHTITQKINKNSVSLPQRE